jgi:hypothetical protein
MFIEESRDSLTVKPLTDAERKWCEELEALLRRAPKRLGLVTIGDTVLTVIDANADRKIYADTGEDGLHDGGSSRNGIALASVSGRITIHGVSG